MQSEPGSPVTYGFTAEEHKASGCQVTVPHHQIVCKTVPGFGRNLMWRLKIGGQQTIPNQKHVSHYGLPTITSISPAGGPTVGGTRITLTGANFLRVLCLMYLFVLFGHCERRAQRHNPTHSTLTYTSPSTRGPTLVAARVCGQGSVCCGMSSPSGR